MGSIHDDGLFLHIDSKSTEIGPLPEDFWTPVGSGQQRLPNGNTLICAMNWSETGRIFEVTPAGEIVWEFWDPEAQALYRAARYPPRMVDPLLQG